MRPQWNETNIKCDEYIEVRLIYLRLVSNEIVNTQGRCLTVEHTLLLHSTMSTRKENEGCHLFDFIWLTHLSERQQTSFFFGKINANLLSTVSGLLLSYFLFGFERNFKKQRKEKHLLEERSELDMQAEKVGHR